MMKDPEDYDHVTIDVYLKDGKQFICRDVPTNMMGTNETIVSFWDFGKIKVIPMDLVSQIDMHFDPDKSEYNHDYFRLYIDKPQNE